MMHVLAARVGVIVSLALLAVAVLVALVPS
jgi:hypothetical protein